MANERKRDKNVSQEIKKAREKASRKLTEQKKKVKDSVSKRLTLGSLCRAFKEAANGVNILVPEEGHLVKVSTKNQENFVMAICSLVYPGKTGLPVKPSPALTSSIFNNWEHIDDCCLKQARQYGAYDIIRQNVEERVYDVLDDVGRMVFLVKLQELIGEIPGINDTYDLKSYIGFVYDERAENCKKEYCDIIAKCVYWCLTTDNKWERIPTAVALTQKPNIKYKYDYDPHHFLATQSSSTAIQLTIYEDINGELETIFDSYNYEDFMEFMLQNNLVIQKVNCSLGLIEAICSSRKSSQYTLRRVGPEDYEQVRTLIYKHIEEFREKRNWLTEKNKNLAEMVYNGLSEVGKWTAYAYYADKDTIVAYLDYKIRSDGDFELGTQLIVPECREQKLARGLINFLRLKYMNSRFFAGTYEENKQMKTVFANTGFVPHLFFDPETGAVSNQIKERINRTHPEDDSLMTNSVYFYADSIIYSTRYGTLKIDDKTGEVIDPIND